MKTKPVIITPLAENDVLTQFDWWASSRSEEQALRWLVGIYTEMFGLKKSANQHPLAMELPLRSLGVRQLNYGISKRPTHRALYAIKDREIVIYRVRSLHQDRLSEQELTVS